jgi:isopenicillin-N N-acyltransferase-like protein
MDACSILVLDMTSCTIPVLHLHGDAYTRGYQHGVAMRLAIQAAAERSRRTHVHGGLQRAKRLAGHSWTLIETVAPDITAEMKGIAEGSGLAPLDVYLLSGFEFFNHASPAGCTTAAIATGSGAVVAQNWDAPPGTEEQLVLLVHDTGDDGFAMITTPGTLGWVGMNRSGFAFVTNDLMLDTAEHGLPSLVVRRLLLREKTVRAGLETLARHDHRAGRCYLLGDGRGEVAGVEISPSIGSVLLPGHPLVHTNHPVIPALATRENIETVARVYPSSRERLSYAHHRSVREAKDVFQLLASAEGAPDAICKSASQREPTQTAFSVVFDCRNATASICIGRPDRGTYRAFDFSCMATA